MSKLKAVIVCTTLRGVFFGYTDDVTGETIKLTKSRNAYYWECKTGILELGSKGPGDKSKIGARADIELRGISAVISCTPEAIKAWEAASWTR